jgi:hypothetical protein
LSPSPPETPAAWAQWIAPETLRFLVRNTAPFLDERLPPPQPGRLAEIGRTPDGHLRILASWENALQPNLTPEEQLTDYFALCLACHHSTVATFVPTDVDTKIRGIVWRETRDPAALEAMLRLCLFSQRWTDDGISTRRVRGVSGHDGEHWSALAGGLGRLLELGLQQPADEALAAIEAEIDRQQTIFEKVAKQRDAEIDLLGLAMTLAHNRGDLTQGMGFWKRNAATAPVMDHLSTRGRFQRAVFMYQQTGLSAEGHRHYPLRAVKALRRSPEFLLPLSPFLDAWGNKLSKLEDPHEVLTALVEGCQKLPGQQGYYRAIAGLREANPGAFDRAVSRTPNATQRQLRGGEMRKLIDVSRSSFEAMMRKRARTAFTAPMPEKD